MSDLVTEEFTLCSAELCGTLVVLLTLVHKVWVPRERVEAKIAQRHETTASLTWRIRDLLQTCVLFSHWARLRPSPQRGLHFWSGLTVILEEWTSGRGYQRLRICANNFAGMFWSCRTDTTDAVFIFLAEKFALGKWRSLHLVSAGKAWIQLVQHDMAAENTIINDSPPTSSLCR